MVKRNTGRIAYSSHNKYIIYSRTTKNIDFVDAKSKF